VRVQDGCIFCAIVAGRALAFRVAEDEHALAFMDIFPVSDGHTLVIPKDHARDVFEMQDVPMRAVAAMARRVAGAIRAEIGPDGLAVYQANGEAAGQTVWHYHQHLIPRRRGDAMSFHGRGKGDEARLRSIAAKLAARVGPAGGGAS
jgi:histidine triad (HIT) family protein